MRLVKVKPYSHVPIVECHEKLVEIPPKRFGRILPHAYEAAGAPYGSQSPWIVRESVLAALEKATDLLADKHTDLHLCLFDAYRPLAVQEFMVAREWHLACWEFGFDVNALTDDQKEKVEEKVFHLWSIPSKDPRSPPPHSTGAALDLTLQDAKGQVLDMGCPIDENSPRAAPDYFMRREGGKIFHERRQILREVMQMAGFVQHQHEWWHFSLHDQYWVWGRHGFPDEKTAARLPPARYGRIDP
jgi:zinc D-Ala-D-Ala dipeptidase